MEFEPLNRSVPYDITNDSTTLYYRRDILYRTAIIIKKRDHFQISLWVNALYFVQFRFNAFSLQKVPLSELRPPIRRLSSVLAFSKLNHSFAHLENCP